MIIQYNFIEIILKVPKKINKLVGRVPVQIFVVNTCKKHTQTTNSRSLNGSITKVVLLSSQTIPRGEYNKMNEDDYKILELLYILF